MSLEIATKDVYMAAQGSDVNTVTPYTKDKGPCIVMDGHVKKLGNLTIDDMSDRDELKRYDFDNEIDLDMYYYSNLDINCNYYTEQ